MAWSDWLCGVAGFDAFTACWFVDTDYNGESFFFRHAYFFGANDPYKSLKTTLKVEIDPEAWATLNSDTSRWRGEERSFRGNQSR